MGNFERRCLLSVYPQIFLDTLYYQLMQAGSPYRQFALDFVWSGSELKTYRMRLLPKYMARSEQRAFWMQQLREDCDAAINPQALLNSMLQEAESEPFPEDPEELKEKLQLQQDLEQLKGKPIAPLSIASYTYMMVFYESDLGILSSVLINMLSAGVAMLLVSSIKWFRHSYSDWEKTLAGILGGLLGPLVLAACSPPSGAAGNVVLFKGSS